MNTYTRQFQYTVNAPLAFVYGHFTDLRKFRELHPYMTSVEQLNENTYRIKEKVFLFGFLPMKPVYDAQVFETGTGNRVFYTSHVKKGVDLKINFDFLEMPEKKEILITETIEVTASKITAGLFLNLMGKAHKKLFETLINSTKK